MLNKKALIKLISIISVLCLSVVGCKNMPEVPEHRLQWWYENIMTDAIYTDNIVTVAIIDTAIDKTHPDLKRTIIETYKLPHLSDSDNFNHGTAIAGIISAYPDCATGVLGIAPNTSILSIDVTESLNTIEISNLIMGIEYAIENEVDIINISSGFKTDSTDLHNVIEKAYSAGIILIACTGNNEDYVMYPAKYKEVIAISSYDKNEKIMYNYLDEDATENIIYLPGEYIVTIGVTDDIEIYTSLSGTSFSTPIMTGLVTICLKNNPNIDIKEVYSLLETFYGRKINNANVNEIINVVLRDS